MLDRCFFLTLQAIRRQLAAMPYDLYLVRLIDHATRRAFPGERLWTATQLTKESVVRFLRIRNREGCDVYVQPYADNHNAGYVLLDLDHGDPSVLEDMCAHGNEPCVLLQTSPGHLQAWVRVSDTPLEPAIASAIARSLARTYEGDLASADWRHLGRLAGFTNQKLSRRQANGYAPWVRVLHTQLGSATQAISLVQAAQWQLAVAADTLAARPQLSPQLTDLPIPPVDCSRPRAIYQAWLQRLRIPQRFPQTDWSIADKWIAKELLQRGISVAEVAALLRAGSPDFPRRHADPEDYLHRTLIRALRELHGETFPAPRAAPCVGVAGPG
jgi:RepB DNA-primase from phage plasmid